MAIDSVEATQGLQGGGSTGDVTMGLDPPVSRQNGGTGVSVVTTTQLVNQLGALPTSGGHMSGNLTVAGGILVGPALAGLPEAGTLHVQHHPTFVPPPIIGGTVSALHVVGGDDEPISLDIDGFSSGTGAQAGLVMRAARVGPSQTQTDDGLGSIRWIGFNGPTNQDYAAGASVRIIARATENFSATGNGGHLAFGTLANGQVGQPPIRMIIGQGVVVGSPSLGGDIPGAVNAQGGFYDNGVKLAAGGAGLPVTGGTITDPAGAGDLLTIRTRSDIGQANRLIFDQPATNPDHGPHQWMIGNGAGGSFGIWHPVGGTTAFPIIAINYLNDEVQLQAGNLNLNDNTAPMHYILRGGTVGNRKLGFQANATPGDPLEEMYIHAEDVIITGDLEVGGTAVPSDRRLKQNLEPWNRGLDEVRQLNPISFEYNGLGGLRADGRMRIGLDADNAGDVIPEMVGTRRSGHLTITPDTLTFALINAVKELADRLEALERSK